MKKTISIIFITLLTITACSVNVRQQYKATASGYFLAKAHLFTQQSDLKEPTQLDIEEYDDALELLKNTCGKGETKKELAQMIISVYEHGVKIDADPYWNIENLLFGLISSVSEDPDFLFSCEFGAVYAMQFVEGYEDPVRDFY